MAKLNTYVPVTDTAGIMHLFGPGDEIPEWAVEAITNPHVWVGGAELEAAGVSLDKIPEASEAVVALTGADTASASGTAVVADADGSQITPAESALPIPAKGGPKATAEAWAGYAVQEIAKRGLNIEIPADAKRADIIEALEAAEIPTGE